MTDGPRDLKAESADLLIELGCEELPPKALDQLREAFYASVAAALKKQNIAFDEKDSRSFSTPRRLALQLRNVATSQPDQTLQRRGPAVSAAFDADGKPTRAALGFAHSVGLQVDELGREATDKGEWLSATVHRPGQSLDTLVFPILEAAARQLPVPRPMRWADHDFSFVRPVHWLVVLHGTRVLEGELFGLSADRLTRGHRIHAPGPHDLSDSSAYEAVLQQAFVIADPARRRAEIRTQVEAANPDALIDGELLAEVTNLVEWPVAVRCTFEEEFLEVPHAALVASMQDHQKFFPVRENGAADRVTNRFVAIANLESTNPGAVRDGYERVIRPRLADARFFLEQDQKQSLEDYLPVLDDVVFQKQIGTISDKCQRIAIISKKLATALSTDPESCARAALLSKCDLMTQMVGEFPELQGLMGQHYALHSGESPEVAGAIGEHYAPAFAGDAIPVSMAGRIVSIADRADTLVGIFAAGLRPSGNKDPYALRRAALGLVRILLEGALPVSLNRVLAMAANQLSGKLEIDPALLVDVREFVVERLRHYYREQGFGARLINAALASDWETLPDLDQRLRALHSFMGGEAASSLAAANKRIGNILRKSGESISTTIDSEQFILGEEKHLFGEIIRLEELVEPLLEEAQYAPALQELSGLRNPVDDFFDAVMVMDEDAALRANRLALLARLKALFDRIADLSVLG